MTVDLLWGLNMSRIAVTVVDPTSPDVAAALTAIGMAITPVFREGLPKIFTASYLAAFP